LSLFSVALLRQDGQRLQTSTESSLVALGQWLNAHTPAAARLAISDVGAAPYFARRPALDINPESLTDRTIAENGWSSEYFYAVDPDVVVLTAFSLTEPDFYPQHEALYAEPQFQARYRLLGITRNDWYWDRAYWTFVRREMAFSAGELATFPQGMRKE
jgi:hypothetical protein